MTSTEPQSTQAPPQAVPANVKRRRFFSVVWLVPLVAAGVAGYLVYQRVAQAGPLITIRFADGEGLKPGQSPVKYRGVAVGEVRSIALSRDLHGVLVEARLDKSAAALARQGAAFWIVRPEVGLQNITGLGTIISGPYIEVIPGTGPPAKVFQGVAPAPVRQEEKGLSIRLLSPTRGSLRAGSPVYYRGMEVGHVQEQRLSDDARLVESDVFIEQSYAALVRDDSRFWNVSGVDIDFSLFKGAQVNVESLKSLVSGGVSFATPPPGKGNEPAGNGALFRLYDEPKKEWLEWSPAIPLPARAPAPPKR